MIRQFVIASIFSIIWTGGAQSADYRMTLTDIGKRDYYCTITVRLENLSATALQDLNGFFLSYVGDTESGRSKGASFLNVAPGGSAEAVFETPNAPCSKDATDVTDYRFFVGACRIGGSFVDQEQCATAIEVVAPIANAQAR